MDAKHEIDVTLLSEPVLNATVDLLGLVVLGDPTKDSVFKSVDLPLGGVLA